MHFIFLVVLLPFVTADLSPAQKGVADILINIFEFDSKTLDYARCADYDDGRGLTAGRGQFTTSSGDLLEVLENYNGVYKSYFNVYMSRLKTFAARNDGSTAGLKNFCGIWKWASLHDPEFRLQQDSVNDFEYYFPALRSANKNGLTLPLTIAFLYDTCTQEGESGNAKSLDKLLAKTNAAVRPPKRGGNERAWLAKAIDVRYDLLRQSGATHAADFLACHVFGDLLERRNLQLSGTITVKTSKTKHSFSCTNERCK